MCILIYLCKKSVLELSIAFTKYLFFYHIVLVIPDDSGFIFLSYIFSHVVHFEVMYRQVRYKDVFLTHMYL